MKPPTNGAIILIIAGIFVLFYFFIEKIILKRFEGSETSSIEKRISVPYTIICGIILLALLYAVAASYHCRTADALKPCHEQYGEVHAQCQHPDHCVVPNGLFEDRLGVLRKNRGTQ